MNADLNSIPLSSSTSGFENIKRYWDKTRNAMVAKILPGEIYVSIASDEFITTVLGSCISACIWDAENKVGGMNHFMLPLKSGVTIYDDVSIIDGLPTRYGNFAMEHLINEMLKRGAIRRNLKVKIFGGGAIFGTKSDVGGKNIEFVKNYLYQENMKLISEDVGKQTPRKILFEPISGRVWVKRLQSIHNDTLIKREQSYLSSISEEKEVDGDIELFDD